MGKPLPFANQIRELRDARGITQAELAKSIAMTRQTVIALEKGKYSPSLEAAFRIARHLGAPLEEVFTWRGDNNENG